MPSERTAKQIFPGYEILKKIGSGGMGAVYKARQKTMDRIVALKVLPRVQAQRTEFKERFFREARAAGRLNHPNIVTAIDANEAAGYCFIAMEFIDGESVADKLKREGMIEEREALSIGIQILRGLEHAWDNSIIHRDVKPENFLLSKDRVAKLCDLGIAKAPTDASLTQEGKAIGTPKYISPEQARGNHEIDFRADVYSLGASLYHMIAGEPPFDGPTAPVIMMKHLNEPLPPLRKRAPHVSKNAAAVIEKMMAKKPDKRYANAQALLADLEAAAEGQPVSALARRTSTRTKATGLRPAASISRSSRNATTTGVIVAAILILLVIGAVYLVPSQPGNDANGDQPDPDKPGTNAPAPAGSRIGKARSAFLHAKQLEEDQKLEEAHAAYSHILEIWHDTEYAPLARVRLREVKAALEVQKTRAATKARFDKAKDALTSLLAKEESTPLPEMIEALKAFQTEWADTPSAAAATAALKRLQARLVAQQEQARRDDPAERAKRIQQAREALRGGDASQVLRILAVIREKGEKAADLRPDVTRLAHAGSQANIRAQALKALAAIDAQQACQEACNQVQTDRNETVRLQAIDLIVQKNFKQAKDILESVKTKDPSPLVAEKAKQALDALKP